MISKVGFKLYEAFIKYYTKRQWDKFPEELDSSVLARLPVKYTKDPYYFGDRFQGMPEKGFTDMFKKMLDNKNITLKLNTDFFRVKNSLKYDKLIYTGPIDRFFGYKFKKLEYRGIHFIFKTLGQENFQPNSVVNHTAKGAKFSRITEFKKFHDIKHDKTVICKEIFCWGGDPCYPIMNKKNLALLKKYEKETKKLKHVLFIGRLAQYKYFNMDQVVKTALAAFEKIKART